MEQTRQGRKLPDKVEEDLLAKYRLRAENAYPKLAGLEEERATKTFKN